MTGSAITQVRDGIYLVDVVVRADRRAAGFDRLVRTCRFPFPAGTVPLSQFATFEYGQEYPLVWRRDRARTLTVQADVVPGVLPETVVDDSPPR